jgi:transcription antitermination factor NusG
LRVRAGHEKAAARALRQRGYIEFLPLYASMRRWSDRRQEIELPLFPGYIFCHFDLLNRLALLMVPAVKEIVGIGKTPHPVDENEITVLQRAVESGALLKPWPFLKVGQRVIIQEGPLRNIEGILAEIRGEYKLVLSVSLLQRSVAVCVDRTFVHPLPC